MDPKIQSYYEFKYHLDLLFAYITIAVIAVFGVWFLWEWISFKWKYRWKASRSHQKERDWFNF